MRAIGLILLATTLAGCAGGVTPVHGFVSLAGAADGARLYWEQLGPAPSASGPSVLVFHGGPGAPEATLVRQPFWRALTASASVLYFDQRGAGRSAGPDVALGEAPPSWNLAQFADDGEALRTELLGSGAPVVAFGVSAGAQVALLYALRHPEHVRGLVLVEPAADHRWVSAQRQNLSAFLAALVADDSAAQRGLARALAADAPPLCPPLSADALRFALGGRLAYTRAAQLAVRAALAASGAGDSGRLCELARTALRSDALPAADPRSESVFHVVACRELGWGAVATGNCKGIAETARLDLSDRLAAIRVPVLILSSANDPIVPTRLHDEVWRGLGGDVTLVRFEDSGHLVLQEEPARAARAVRAFLDELGAQ